MSEYQYYEFQAIDKPLSKKQMSELRGWSTRAEITSTMFVNEYHWGNFKGDADEWMLRYFDAFLYLANWGTRTFKLRLPSNALDDIDVDAYATHSLFDAVMREEHVVLSFVSEDEGGDGECYTDGVLSSLIPIRNEIACGDIRALYLGWLRGVQAQLLDPGDMEPPLPPGLGELSDALEDLVDFLRIDIDLLEVAAEASLPMSVFGEPSKEVIIGWLAKQPGAQRDDWLIQSLFEGSAPILAEVQRRFREQHAPASTSNTPRIRRTVGELLDAAEARADERERSAKQKAADKAERLRLEEESRRNSYLNGLIGQENRLWTEADNLAKTKLAPKYDAAVQILEDLRDLAARTDNTDFLQRFEAFRTAHIRKPSLLERIRKANL